MKNLPLTILVHEGPMARAYLGTMKELGYLPDRILVLVQTRDVATRKPVLSWLPSFLRKPAAARIQDLRMNFWPRELHRRHRDLVEAILASLAVHYGVPSRIAGYLLEPSDYATFGTKVETLLVDGFRDAAFHQWLGQQFPGTAVLFTGGGLLPPSVLAYSNVKFIHVHPGFLPQVKGSDGLLWSTLVRGCPGATCFYMNKAIDGGEIVLARDLPPLALPQAFHDLSVEDQYRLLYSFVDPLLRAALWGEVVKTFGEDLYSMPCRAQEPGQGQTYYFMSDHLRRIAMSRLAHGVGQT